MKNTPHQSPQAEQPDEELLLAFLLDETDQATSEQLRQKLEEDPTLIAKASRLQQTTDILKEALESPASDTDTNFSLDPERRAQLISQFAQPSAHEEKGKNSKLLSLSHPIWGFGIAACFVSGIFFSIIYQSGGIFSNHHYDLKQHHELAVSETLTPPADSLRTVAEAPRLEEPAPPMKIQQLELMLNPGSGSAYGNIDESDLIEGEQKAQFQRLNSDIRFRRQSRREEMQAFVLDAPIAEQAIGNTGGPDASKRDVGSAITIVNREFLEDFGATNNASLLQYTTSAETGGNLTTNNVRNFEDTGPQELAFRPKEGAAKPLFGHFEEDEEIFELSPFTVAANSSSGYRAKNTLAGSRLKISTNDVDTSRYTFFSPDRYSSGIPDLNKKATAGKKDTLSPPRISFQDDIKEYPSPTSNYKAHSTNVVATPQEKQPNLDLTQGLDGHATKSELEIATYSTPPIEEEKPAIKLPSTSLNEYPETRTLEDPQSTFSLNVSDISYRLATSYIDKGIRPPAGTLRTEEFVNAFDYGDPTPDIDRKIGFTWERAHWPWAHDRDVIRFSLQTAAEGRASKQPLNLVLAIDSSGSMSRPDRVEIVDSLANSLQSNLTERDRLSVVSFDRSPRLVLDGQPVTSQFSLSELTQQLNPQGGTDLESALDLAYETANRHHNEKAINRVILVTDGAANLGNTDVEELRKNVIENRVRGIALDCFGIGFDGHDDTFLESLSRNGDGRYRFLRSTEDAALELGEKLAGMLRPAAYDVKVQVEFNPQRVELYQQLGYQQHQISDKDFRNNAVDAAELAAAEAGTALYLTKILAEGRGDIGLVRVRYRDAVTGIYNEMSWNLPYKRTVPELSNASASLKLASTAAAFAALLNESPFAQEIDFSELYQFARPLKEEFPTQSQVQELPDIIMKANRF